MMRSGLSSGNVAGHRKPHHSLSGLSDGRLQERSSRNGAAVRGKLLYGRNVGFLRLLPFLQFLPCLFRPTVPAHFLLRSLNIGSLHSVRSKAEGTYQQRKYYFYSDSHLFNYKFLTRKTEQYPFIFYPYARSHRHRAPSHPALPLPAKELVRDALSPFVQSSPHLR